VSNKTGAEGERAQGQHFDGDLRRVLLDAAAAAIVERGVDGVSLRELARRAGVSHAAPAHHFGDKSGLHTALAVEGFDLLAGRLEDVLGDEDGAADGEGGVTATDVVDVVEALVQIGGEYVRFATDRPAHFEVMFRPSLLRVDDPELARAADRAHRALDRTVARCIADGWGGSHDPEALSAFAWGVVHGLGALRAQGALGRYYPNPTLARVTDIIRMFASGFAAPASGPRRG
jgi:AcrR family transcriptional regulator